MWARVVVVLVFANVARAEPPLQRCGIGGYVEPSAMLGTATRLVGPGDEKTSLTWLAQVGAGVSDRFCSDDRLDATRVQLGLGLVFDGVGPTSYKASGGIGFEAAADHTIAPEWRLGGAASVDWGDGNIIYTLGARLHYRDWGWVGLEVVRVQPQYFYDPCSNPTTTVQGCQASVTGVYAGFGAEHRYIAYGTGAALVVGGVIAAIIAAGLGAVH